MAHVGYARVSSVGQSFAVQLAKLQAVGCAPIFQEKASGTRDDRPALHECLRYVRKGDALCITRLDRLAPIDVAPVPARGGVGHEGCRTQGD